MSKPINQSRLEVKVGMFVFVCLAVLAVLLLQFSKGVSPFRGTYSLVLDSANVGGLRPRAQVLLSGVQVGTVIKTELSPTGTNVLIFLKIFKQYTIKDDAIFKIEQSGFLGDQYIAVYPMNSAGRPLKPGSMAHAIEPFNLQEVARSTSGFIQRLDVTAKKLDSAIDDVKRLVLNDRVLTNFSETIMNLRQTSDEALATVGNLDAIIKTNGRPATDAISNLVVFSARLQAVADHADSLISSNGPPLTEAINNIKTSTATITNLLSGIDSGKGVAGAILKDEQLSGNISSVANNLAITTSNINRLGFWHWLWYKPPQNQAQSQNPNPQSPRPPVYPSANP